MRAVCSVRRVWRAVCGVQCAACVLGNKINRSEPNRSWGWRKSKFDPGRV